MPICQTLKWESGPVTNRKIDLSATIRLLGNVLGEVIAELESQALFRGRLPRSSGRK
jgi:hypothetical protein